MSPNAGFVLMDQIAPRLRATIPYAVRPTGAEDAEELLQDATVLAAQMLHSLEARGKEVTVGNVCYYVTLLMKSGRRSQSANRTDALSPGAMLDRKSVALSLEEPVGLCSETGETVALGDLLAGTHEDPAATAARNLDWAQFLDGHDARYPAMLRCAVSGQPMNSLSGKPGASNSSLSARKRQLAGDIRAFMGEDVLREVCQRPRWQAEVESERERTHCQSAAALHDALRPCFVKSWPFPRLDERQVDALRAIIHPEIILELPLEYDPAPRPLESSRPVIVPERAKDTPPEPTRQAMPKSERAGVFAPPAPTLKVLDLRQENHARAIGDGHRILSGVAGSGKTVILLARAKLLAQRDPAARVLVLCFNVTLASFLRGQLRKLVNVQVCHFEGWATANRVRRDMKAQESDESLGQRLLAALAESDGANDARRFDAVLVDEAQDFEASWFRCVLAAMKDPADGDLLIVGDGNQGVYRRGKVSWKSLGIQASGRTISGRFGLDINYRNSREIAALAQAFADGSTEHRGPVDEDTIGALSMDLGKCPRTTGRKPVLCREGSREKECERAVKMVADLLAGRWAGERLPEPLRPEQIGILYRRIAQAEQPLFARFLTDLQTVTPMRWLNAKDDVKARTRVLEPGVKVQTIHAAKGLQYRAVILLWAGDLPYLPSQSQHDEHAERRLFYVGLTRAEDFLALTAPTSALRSEFVNVVEALQRAFVPLAG